MKAVLRGDAGEGLAVVYVPGIDGTGALLLGLEARLEARYRLVRLGYDAGEDVPDTYADLAATIAAVVRARGIERCLVLAESFGGAVALQLALDHAGLVAGLMIVNSFAYYAERGRLALAQGLAPLVPGALFALGRRWFAPSQLFGEREDPQARAAFQAQPGSFFDEGYERRMQMIRGLDLRSRLGEVLQPVALYAGDADRVVPSVESLEILRRGLPDATLEVLPGGGHLVLPLAEEPWPERVADLARRAGLPGGGTGSRE